MLITRPVMRYPGGKFTLAKWVISHFPAHKTYVELYGGAASILMRKPRSEGEVYNDLNDEVVNVFLVLRDKEQAAELAHLLALTPYAYTEYAQAYEPSDDPVEKARRMIFRSFAGHGSDSVSRPKAGFRGYKNKETNVTAAQEWMNFAPQITVFSERLQGVTIEHREAIRIIQIYDRENVLFYADPPYVRSTRPSKSVQYPCEVTDAGHEELAEALHHVKGMAIVSGYPSELYERLYRGWRFIPKAHHAQTAKPTTEGLWLSPNIHTTLF